MGIDSETPTDGEDNFRINLRLIRETLGMTQGHLAAKLAEQNLPFHQQTIQKIEQGARKVKLLEGVAIASVLGVSVERMLKPPEDFSLQERLTLAVRKMREGFGAIEIGAIEWCLGAREAQSVIDQFLAQGVKPVEPTKHWSIRKSMENPETLANDLWRAERELERTPEQAVELGREEAEIAQRYLRAPDEDANEQPMH